MLNRISTGLWLKGHCVCVLVLFAIALMSFSVTALAFSGENHSELQLGEHGSDGNKGAGGSGGAGGEGGSIGGRPEDAAPFPQPGKKGKPGSPGSAGGAAGNGGTGTWVIGSAIVINEGVILLGGEHGIYGIEGDKGGNGGSGGSGASLKASLLPPFFTPDGDGIPGQYADHCIQTELPNDDCSHVWGSGAGGQSSTSKTAAGDGFHGVDGGGGGGGGANNVLLPLFYASGIGGRGGNGRAGLGSTGSRGTDGSVASVMTIDGFRNTGKIQLGGNGGDGGAGGNGGYGGGGGGGSGADIFHVFFLDGGAGGGSGSGVAGGTGGAGGEGGDGVLEIRGGGLFHNASTGELILGHAAGGQKPLGTVYIAADGALDNSGSILVHNGGLTIFPGATLTNNGVITVPTLLSNHGVMQGNGTLMGSLQNHGVLNPGNSPGSMMITGDYLESGSLMIEMGETESYDYLTVSGDVYLDQSSILALQFLDPFEESGLDVVSHFDIVRYTGDLQGSFGAIDSASANLQSGNWSLDYAHALGGGVKSIRLSYYASPPPGPTSPTNIPTMSAYGLVLIMLGLLLVAGRRLRASAKRS